MRLPLFFFPVVTAVVVVVFLTSLTSSLCSRQFSVCCITNGFTRSCTQAYEFPHCHRWRFRCFRCVVALFPMSSGRGSVGEAIQKVATHARIERVRTGGATVGGHEEGRQGESERARVLRGIRDWKSPFLHYAISKTRNVGNVSPTKRRRRNLWHSAQKASVIISSQSRDAPTPTPTNTKRESSDPAPCSPGVTAAPACEGRAHLAAGACSSAGHASWRPEH